MRSRIVPLTALLTLSVLGSLGCVKPQINIGPTTHTQYVIVNAGKPLEVLENTTVRGRVLDGSGDVVYQDVGGWIMMPPAHWETLKAELKLEKGIIDVQDPHKLRVFRDLGLLGVRQAK